MDRCDRCGAEAKTMSVLGAAEVLLCQHHTNQHVVALEEQGWDVWALEDVSA